MAIKSGYSAEDLAKLGPDVLTRKRLLAEAMLNDSTKQRKIAHPLQGLQQIAETLVNGLDVRKIDKATMTGQDAADKDWSSLFGSGSSSVPSPAAAGEISSTSPSPSSGGNNSDVSGVESYIREAATKRGIDPEVAVKVARSEGLAPGVWQSNVVRGDGKRETSYGPFQLLVGGGLGDKFQKLYGKSPADPSTVNQQIDFALDEAAAGGWSPWYGAAKVGVGSRTGLDKAKALGYNPAQVASLDPSAGMSAQPPMPAPAAQAQIQGPQPPALPLPPPATVPNAPQVAAQPLASAPAPQQLAQALTGGQPAPASSPAGPSPQDLAKILSNPWVSDERKQVARMLLGQQGQRQQAQYEQQLQQSDPKYRQDLEKGSLELENLKNPKMSPAEQAADQRDREKMAFERQKFEEEVKKGQWEKMTDGRLYNKTTGDFKDAPPPVPGSIAPKMDDISGIRKEIQQLPSYKNLAQAAPIYKAMAETAGRNSKASDLNLVYGLGKIMDPTSVVREGEMVMVKNTASLPDWLQGAIASLNGGAALTPETRQAIMTEAYGRVKGYNDEFQQNMGQYQGIVQRNGINPADVIPQPEAFEPWKMPEAPPGAVPTQDNEPAPEGMDPAIWKFVPPEDRKLWRK